MSAMTGIWLFLAMIGSASASSRLGTATRTMSQPDAVSSAICCSVALMLVVGVVVIDWTLTGASPPTSTLPTLIWRDLRRGARVSGTLGIPRLIAATNSILRGCVGGGWVPAEGRPDVHWPNRRALAEQVDRLHDVRVHQQHAHPAEDDDHGEGQRHELGHVHRPRVAAAEDLGEGTPQSLPQRSRDVPAVERQQRDEVEDE